MSLSIEQNDILTDVTMVKFIVPQLLLFGTPDNIGIESGSGSAEGLQTKYPYRPFIGSHKKLRNL